jgi:signal transduction histidine kinase
LLRQLLTHIMGNAVKFSRSRTSVRVSLTWCRVTSAAQDVPGAQDGTATDYCQISVTDNGVGFAPAQASKLFKVFSRLHPARDFEGLGLGLVSSKKIMERLGGRINIAGQVDAGCRVTLTLPAA